MDNKQALGYMLLSCEQFGYTKNQMKEIYREMYWQFDLKTEEEAEEKDMNIIIPLMKMINKKSGLI